MYTYMYMYNTGFERSSSVTKFPDADSSFYHEYDSATSGSRGRLSEGVHYEAPSSKEKKGDLHLCITICMYNLTILYIPFFFLSKSDEKVTLEGKPAAEKGQVQNSMSYM